MKKRGVAISGILWALILAVFLLPNLMAQDQDVDQGQDPGQDPPDRVGRLNYTVGSVSLQPGGEGDWVQAVNNRPITTGDNIWADKDARAELHVGSTALRVDSETSVTFLDLDDHTTQLKLSQGSIILRVRHMDDGDLMEVDTPNLAFDIQGTGEYRIDVNNDGSETATTVWKGRGEATGGGESYVVVAGQRARFTGSDQLDHEIYQIPSKDDFDNFAFSRDQKEDRSESANYISTEMTGYEDLDDYGNWHYAADYGPVWTPSRVAVGWAPYRSGHWAWVGPWGWTWVEDEPWGFAPFHYGRWAYVQSSWCWVPGPVVVRPVYAPALVAFVGGGGFSVGVGFGGGSVGWFPLGPREVYVPWYRSSRGYVNNVNITNTRVNITQVTNVYNVYNNNSRTTNVSRVTYMNQRGPAVTAVSHDTFINARPVGRNIVRVDDRQIMSAQVNARPDVQPVRASVMGAGAPARFRPPTTVINRQVVATRNPAPARVTFDQRGPVNSTENRPATNVRTETPGTPSRFPQANQQQPARQGQPGLGQPGQGFPTAQGASRPAAEQQRQDLPRPNPTAPAVGQVQNPAQVARPDQTNRPSGFPNPGQMSRPQTGQPETPRADDRQVPRPPQAGVNPGQPMRNDNQQTINNNNRGQDNRPFENRGVDNRSQDNRMPDNRSAEVPRPQVRTAPPVQDRPDQQRNEEQKFRGWQQQQQQRQQQQQQQQNQQQRPAARAPEQRAPAPQPRAPQQQAPQSHSEHQQKRN